MITCKLTGKIGHPVKSHVVPKAFYEIPPQEDGPLISVSNTPNSFPRKVPVGIYDETMVTLDGETLFKPWDEYAIRILLKEEDAVKPVIRDGVVLRWILPEYEYSALKLFALSLLWRAHTSTQREFSRVQLGPHEATVRNCLLQNQPGTPEEYSVLISKWMDQDVCGAFMDPIRRTHLGLNYYRIYCGRYIFDIKVDRRPTNADLRSIQMGQSKQLFVMARDLKTSKEWPAMLDLARFRD